MLKAKRTLISAAVLAASMSLTGCATTYQEMNYTEEGAVYGTLAGAAAGAGVGLWIGGTLANALGAPIGAVVGGVTGGIIGHMMNEPKINMLNVPFRTGSAVIEPKYYPQLDELVAQLREWPDAVIDINGHTDNAGPSPENMALSELRAQSVAAYLTRHGVDAWRINEVPYGETAAVASNSTSEGRFQNREAKVTPYPE